MHPHSHLVLTSIAAAALALVPAATAGAQTGDNTLPPAGVVAALTVQGVGVQIYRCEVANGKGSWMLVAPDAKLYPAAPSSTAGAAPAANATAGTPVGTHGAGPFWRWSDGSEVVGKLLEKASSTKEGAAPWLLLALSPSPKSAATGQLTGMTYVRRSDTTGGAAPGQACDASNQGQETRIGYNATYTFYKPAS